MSHLATSHFVQNKSCDSEEQAARASNQTTQAKFAVMYGDSTCSSCVLLLCLLGKVVKNVRGTAGFSEALQFLNALLEPNKVLVSLSDCPGQVFSRILSMNASAMELRGCSCEASVLRGAGRQSLTFSPSYFKLAHLAGGRQWGCCSKQRLSSS